MAMQSHKTNALIEKVQLIATQTRALYKNGDYPDYQSFQIGQDLINAGRTSDLTNPFGGNLTVDTADSGVAFYVLAKNLPAETCSDILTTDWGSPGVFHGIFVEDNTYTYPNGKYPIKTSDAVSVCKGGNKRVTWIFK